MTTQYKETLFAAFLDNTLTDKQRADFDALCISDSEFAQRVDISKRIESIADTFSAPTVPQWDKSRTFSPVYDQTRPSWFSLSGLAIATSACALLAVLTGAQFSVSEKGVELTFVSSPSASEVDALVAQKVAETLSEQRDYYQQANQTLFKEYAQALSTQQRESNAELTEYLLASSREERKQDFTELLTFINDQRIDDQRFYARQFSRLQGEIDEIGYGAAISPRNTRSDDILPLPFSNDTNPTPSFED